MKAPGTLVVARFPSVIVPVCVVKGVSATPCVKEETPCVRETPCVSGTTCASEIARVSEWPSVRETACVRSLYVREMTVGMREHAAASPGVGMNGNVIECSLGVVTRRCVWRAWRLRLRLWRDKSRVAAVVAIGTGPGLHGSERMVRAVPRTRPPRARLRW